MFVDPIRGARGLLVATAVFTVGACSDPNLDTDLRPDGPPEVLAVLVMNDPAAQLRETATYCAPDDAKRPNLVGLPDFTTFEVCDQDKSVAAPMVTDAYPDNWYVRVMFDELLNPNIEKLEEIIDPETGDGTGTYEGHIADTHPVTLECESVNGGMINVEYDGYYSPSGNSITWPLGPSLVIKPNHPELVATNKMCQVTLTDAIKDKQGEKVPANELGPYAFQIAPITPIFLDPSDSGDPDAPTEIDALQVYYDNFYVQFNTDNMDPASIGCDDGTGADECEFTLTDVAANTVLDDVNELYSYSYYPQGAKSEYGFGPYAPVETEKTYTFQLKEGGKVLDHCGVETTFPAPIVGLSKVTFTTNPFDFKSSNFGNGDTVSALKKPSLQFNNVIDNQSLTEGSEYTLSPAPEAPTIGSSTFNDGDFLFLGNYRPGQEYTLTLKDGATVVDAFGKTYTQSGDKAIKWTVAPIALTGTSPADGDTSTKATTGSLTKVSISFNQSMNPASITSDEWSVVDADGNAVAFNATVTTAIDPNTGNPTCNPDGTSTSCTLVFTSTAALAAGDYTFTLKKDTNIDDVLASPTVYTQAADRVITFTVAEATPSDPVQCL
jgi:hypothetical protein